MRFGHRQSNDDPEWRWLEPPPIDWRPRASREGTSVTVLFWTFSELGQAAVFEHRDVYFVDSMVPVESERREIGNGRSGYIWSQPRLGVAVQVPASFLPRHSATQEVEAPNGTAVTVWSTTDLVIDRLAQAVFGGAPERLDQALALRLVAGDDFELTRARDRARDDGPQMEQALDAFLQLYAMLGTEGPDDAGAADAATQTFWSEVDSLGLRR